MGPWWASTTQYQFWSTHIIRSLAHQLKALELKNLTVPSLCTLCASRVCWNWLSTASLEDKRSDDRPSNQNPTKNDMQGLPYWLKALKVANSTILMYWQSAAQRECAGIGRQQHPLEVKRKKNKTNKILLDLYFARAWILETLRAICELLLIFAMFQRSMTTYNKCGLPI